ncbi:MAG TPA: hypothetical protein PKA27_10570 [Fimbriimonadaceae bacterium]|nr:hypothetical protein [Fimbriimonadaceae bacterium]
MRVNPKVGATYRYRISTTGTALSAEGSFEFVAVLTEKLVSVKSGELTWDQKFNVEKGSGQGVFAKFGDSFKEMDGLEYQSMGPSTGDVKKVRVSGVEVAAEGTSNVVFSPKPVKVGETWKAKVESNGQFFNIRYMLKGTRVEKGRRIAEIEGKFADGQAVKTIKPMIALVDLADGKLISVSSEFELSMGTVKLKGSYSVVRF